MRKCNLERAFSKMVWAIYHRLYQHDRPTMPFSLLCTKKFGTCLIPYPNARQFRSASSCSLQYSSMLSSIALQSRVPTCSSFPSHKLNVKPLKTSVHSNSNPISKNRRRLSTASGAAPETLTTETSTDAISSTPVEIEKAKVSVKQVAKPRLVLKFIWMEKNIGLALDQSIPGHGTIPLSPYFFWPRKDAWEELKATLESKPWISQKSMIILLNQATDIINLWQQSGGNLTT